jgi:hypothetical protein
MAAERGQGMTRLRNRTLFHRFRQPRLRTAAQQKARGTQRIVPRARKPREGRVAVAFKRTSCFPADYNSIRRVSAFCSSQASR